MRAIRVIINPALRPRRMRLHEQEPRDRGYCKLRAGVRVHAQGRHSYHNRNVFAGPQKLGDMTHTNRAITLNEVTVNRTGDGVTTIANHNRKAFLIRNKRRPKVTVGVIAECRQADVGNHRLKVFGYWFSVALS